MKYKDKKKKKWPNSEEDNVSILEKRPGMGDDEVPTPEDVADAENKN